jgi:hypothetical protein
MSVVTRIVIFLISIIGIILLFVWLFSKLPNGSTKGHTSTQIVLNNYIAKNSEVDFTIDGPTNSDEQHRSVRITVSADSKEMDVIQGYQGTIINSKTYGNNQTAYDVFMRALSLASFTKVRKTSLTDDRGVCPLGDRYIYQLFNNGTQELRTWTATCNGLGTSGSATDVINHLFEAQIPDYNNLLRNVDLPD